MADTELSALTEDTTPAVDDWFYKVNAAGTVDRKVSYANLLNPVVAVAGDTMTGELIISADAAVTALAAGSQALPASFLGHAMIEIVPTPADLTSGIIMRRPSSGTWGGVQAGGHADYAKGQFLAFFKDGGTTSTDSILFRVDKSGSIGMAGGIHVALNMNGDAPSATQAIWIQPNDVDSVGIVMNAGKASPTANAITYTNQAGSTVLFAVNYLGSVFTPTVTGQTNTGPYFYLANPFYFSVVDRVVSGGEAFPMLAFTGGATRTGATFQAVSGNAAASTIIAYAAASPTAPIQKWVNSTGATTFAQVTATGAVQVAAGSQTAPALANIAETGTGIYFGAGFTALTVNGAIKSYQSATGFFLVDAVDLSLGSTTGSKIGTATTQKLGFYGVTPIVQRAGAAQAAVATTGATLTSYGHTEAQANAIVALVNELRAWAVAQGFIKGAA